MTAEACDNCGRNIGKLETPHVHGEHVVCADCYQRLHPQQQPISYATQAQYAPGSTVPTHREMTAPRVRRTSDSEVVIGAVRTIAVQHVAQAIERLGSVTQRDPGQNFIDGRIKFGLQSAKIRASLGERDPGQTTVVIQGSSDDVWGAAAKNATKRLVQMLENLDNPGFKADRLGIHPAALVGLVILFIIVVVVIVSYIG